MNPKVPLLRLFSAVVFPLLALTLALPPAGVFAQTAGADYDIASGHFYKEANGQGGAGDTGFAVTNDATASFWSEFQRLGGVNALGYPISNRFMWDGFLVQATQRTVMQWRPEVGQVYFVNVYDRMHDLNKDAWLLAFRQTPGIADWSSDTGLPWEQVVARHLAMMNGFPDIEAKYRSVPGDPVQMNGLPMTPVTDMGPFYMLRCQRVTIQQWKIDAPASGAHVGDVVVTLGGDEGKMAGIYPDPAALTPGSPNGSITAGGSINGLSLAVPHQGIGYAMNANFRFDGGIDADMDQLRSAGFPFFIQEFTWKDIQPTPTQYDWSQPDLIMAAAARHNLHAIARIDQQPLWAASNGPGVTSSPPNNMQDLGTFLTAFAQRYKGQVQAYQIWDEPNLFYEWGGEGRVSATEYTNMLRVSYTAIKAVDPTAIIIGGNLTPTGDNGTRATDDLLYLRQMYQAGAQNYFDVFGAHAAGYNHVPDAALGSDPALPHHSFYFRRIEEMRAVMEANGDSGKQMWLTEFGWTSDPINPDYKGFAVSEEQKARNLIQAFNMGKQYPWIGLMSVWNFNYAWMSPPPDEKSYWSVMNPDHTPRTAYLVLAAMPK